MQIKNKDIVLTNQFGQHQKISFVAGTQTAHIWYDEIEDEIIIDGAIRVEDIDTDNSSVSLSHNILSDLNVSPYLHLTQDEYDDLMVLTDGSLVTNLHRHDRVNGHKITVNTGALPSGQEAFDIHIIEN
ncbi:MAG: hypothetical protein ACTSWD_08395 [Candidatus Heimdallarchaeota archaeon]